MFLKKLNKILIFVTLVVLFLDIFIRVKKYRITNYKSNFYKELNYLIQNKDVKKFNFETIENVNENDVVVLNIFGLDGELFTNNLNLSRYLLNKFKNVGIYNIIVEESEEKSSLDLSNLIDDNINEIIYKYNINEPTVYINKSTLDNNKLLANNLNKILILDKVYNKRDILVNDIEVDDIVEKINNVTLKKVLFNKKVVNKNKKIKENDKDSFVYKNMTKMISLENFNGQNVQMFAILDKNTKNIMIIKPDGEIRYIIDCKSFCSPSNIKYFDNKLYVTDSCNGSIEYFDFNDKKLKVFVKNQNLIGINDFEFMNEDYVLVSKIKPNDSLGIFNNNIYTSITDLSEKNAGLVAMPKIGKFNDKYYYFDIDNRILYSFDGSGSSIVTQLTDEYSDKVISDFYINSDSDIYFLYENSSYVLRYYNKTFSEQPIGNCLFTINDFLISKNLFFKLSDSSLEIIDIYHKVNSKIEPFIDRNTENFGDLTEHINLYDDFDFYEFNKAEETLFDFIGLTKDMVLKPSFLIFLSENNNSKLVLNKVVYWSDIYNETNLSEDIKYVVGKLYYKDDLGNFRVKYINSKIKL